MVHKDAFRRDGGMDAGRPISSVPVPIPDPRPPSPVPPQPDPMPEPFPQPEPLPPDPRPQGEPEHSQAAPAIIEIGGPAGEQQPVVVPPVFSSRRRDLSRH